jgi:hypothetical protein
MSDDVAVDSSARIAGYVGALDQATLFHFFCVLRKAA